MAKQVHLKSLGDETKGLFPKLIFDENSKKLVVYVKQTNGTIKTYSTDTLTESTIS